MSEDKNKCIRYSEDFKKSVVKDYLTINPENVTAFCKEHGIEKRSLYRWLYLYKNQFTSTPNNNSVQISSAEYVELLTIRSKYNVLKSLIL